MQITIQAYSFQLSEPFQPGQVLGEAEAQALNRFRAETMRSTIARWVKTAGTGAGELISTGDLERLQVRVGELDARFCFQFQSEGLGAKPGTIQAEARAIAIERVESEARRANVAMSLAAFEEMVGKVLELPAVQEEARKRLAVRLGVTSVALEDL